MSSISNDLIWEITRDQSSFIVKRKTQGGLQLSRDPFALTGKHSPKYTGIANEKAVGVAFENGSVVLLTKKIGSFATPNKSVIKTTFKPNKTNRAVYRAIAGTTKNYRDDLRTDAIKRASSYLASKKSKKTFAKTVRGKKATTA
ncbi:ribosomal L28e/Mak16 [Dipodascopsis uninucleata]